MITNFSLSNLNVKRYNESLINLTCNIQYLRLSLFLYWNIDMEYNSFSSVLLN